MTTPETDAKTMRFASRYGPLITPAEYIEKNISRIPESGCWIWMRGCQGQGYGQAVVNGKGVQAHRLSYSVFIGEVPKSLHVLHKCDVKCCVNPSHLFIGTDLDNLLDWYKKHGGIRPRTHCPRGHELSGDNLYLWRNKRRCVECRRTYRSRAALAMLEEKS